MAGSMDTDSQEVQVEQDCSFVWDELSRLYYHARSGFYHDPDAGWYYSSRDGLYYKFEDGNYVLLESGPNKGDKSNSLQVTAAAEYHSVEEQLEETHSSKEASSTGQGGCLDDQGSDSIAPTSEWLEDTLIELYLSGYSNSTTNATDGRKMSMEIDESNLDTQNNGKGDDSELEEGEWVPDDPETWQSESVSGASWEEENWLAQYGQVVQSNENESEPAISAVDLWDWDKVTGVKRDRKGHVTRLVGRLMRRSVKLHPSMPAGGSRLKTAPICESRLNLVRVTSGQVYKLRNPSAKYLASLSAYDSSNPTKDWGFPELQPDKTDYPCLKSSRSMESEMVCGESSVQQNLRTAGDPILPEKFKNHAYRDRAAERRSLHGGFGVGPGQKNIVTGDDDSDGSESSPFTDCTEVASAEALNMSFGSGSYARRILENMGWKEGNALGSTVKGLKEPLQALGNKGTAGIGWSNHYRMERR